MNQWLQAGGVVAIAALVVRETFSYLKSRGSDGTAKLQEEMLNQLQVMNNNHLHSLQEAIEKGNLEISDAIKLQGLNEHQNSMKMIELLAEIKGVLNSRSITLKK